MKTFINLLSCFVLIATSSGFNELDLNYENVLKLMHSSLMLAQTSETVIVYQEEYGELVSLFVAESGDLILTTMFDLGWRSSGSNSTCSTEKLNESLALGINYAEEYATSTRMMALVVIIDKDLFPEELLQGVRSRWIKSIVVLFQIGSSNAVNWPKKCYTELPVMVIYAPYDNIATGQVSMYHYTSTYDEDAKRSKHECLLLETLEYIGDNVTHRISPALNDSSFSELLYVGFSHSDEFFNAPPAVTGKTEYNVGMLTNGTGLEQRLMHYLGKRLNLRIYPKHLINRLATADETWKMSIDMLLNYEIDVAISRIPISLELAKKVSWSTVYFTEYYVILSKTFSSSDDIFSVFRPFRPRVWWVLMGFILLSGPMFLTMIYFSRSEDIIFTFDVKGVMNTYFHTFRQFFGHATWSQPFCFSFNMFLLMWLLVGLILIVGYNSTITASITSGGSKWEINSLQDLLAGIKDDKVSLVLHEKMDGRGPFKENSQDNSIYSDILTAAQTGKRLKYVNFDAQNVSLMVREDDALVADLTTSYILLRKLKDYQFRVSKQRFWSEMYVIAVRKGFKTLQQFNKILLEFNEFGSLLGWYNAGLKGKNQNLFQSTILTEPILQLSHVYGAFIVYCVGLSLSVLALLSEMIYLHCKRHKQLKIKS